MKITAIAAALSICTAIAAPAYADKCIVYYNTNRHYTEISIENDRSMIAVDDLCEIIGAQSSYNSGVLSVTKGGKTVQYDSLTGAFTADGQELASDIMPVITDDEQLVPVRAIAEALDINVGWFGDAIYDYPFIGDGYEIIDWENFDFESTSKLDEIILKNYDDHMAQMSDEYPQAYELMTLPIKTPKRGTQKVTADFDVHSSEGGFSMQLNADSAAKDEKSTANLTVAKLHFNDTETTLDLEDLTLDCIVSEESMTYYFKTNALEKIREVWTDMPEELQAASELFSSDMWYKISLEDILSDTYYEIYDELMEEIDKAKEHRDELCLADILVKPNFENYSNFWLLSDDEFSDLQSYVDCGIVKLEKDGDDITVSVNVNAETMTEYLRNDWYLWSDEEIDEEELAEYVADELNGLENFALNVKIGSEGIVGINLNVAGNMDDETGISINMSAVCDPESEVEDIELPTSVELMPILRMLPDVIPQNS